MRPHLKVLNLRLSLFLAFATTAAFLPTPRPMKNSQPGKANINFHSVDLMKRVDGVGSSKVGTTEDLPVTAH